MTTPPLQPYPCNQIVYRTAISSKWIKSDGTVRRQAFYRRLTGDEDGLSCAPTPQDLPDLSETRGVITLHVGRVGLDVVPSSATHANITGLPLREGELLDKANFLAGELARIARGLRPSVSPDPEISN